MTPEQIRLVQATFKDVAAIKEQAAELFYSRLFRLDPGLKTLFSGDTKEQGRKLMAAIGVVVTGLDNLDRVLPTVRDLGRRHVAYGVEPRHYDVVGDALLWTLAQGLGDAFTPAVKDAWAAAYGALASVMIEAAADNPVNETFKEMLLHAFAISQRGAVA